LLSKTESGRLVSFETNRGASFSDVTVPYDWSDRHETLEFGRLFAAALNLPDVRGPRDPRPRMFPPSAPPLVMISGLQIKSRRLSAAAWAAVIAKWHQDRTFLITGAEEDGEFVAEVAEQFPKLATRLGGNFNERCDQISWSEELLAMEGSAVQVGSYFCIPTTAIFTSDRERKWHPLGHGSRILRRHDLPCQPCEKLGQLPPCVHHHACLKVDDLVPVNIW
jgi:ADP-heptose:LPS heptosyltransferase